jgi:hypothetical protein
MNTKLPSAYHPTKNQENTSAESQHPVTAHPNPKSAAMQCPIGTPDSGGGPPVNSALTVVSLFIVIWQGPVPVQPPPLQPRNVDAEEGEALRVTVAPMT